MLEPPSPRLALALTESVGVEIGSGMVGGVLVASFSAVVVGSPLGVVLSPRGVVDCSIGVEGVLTGVLVFAMGSCLRLMCLGNGAYRGTFGMATVPSTRRSTAASSANLSRRTIVWMCCIKVLCGLV